MIPKQLSRRLAALFAIHFLLSVAAIGQTSWTLRNPYPTPHWLNGVTWTGSQLVAVGNSGTILTSLDGINWTNRYSGVACNLRGVASSGNFLVAVGDSGCVLFSQDGMRWTAGKRLSGYELNAVFRTDSLFLALSSRGQMFSSRDGVTWTSALALDYMDFENIYAGIWTGTHAVALCLSGTVLMSSDGVNWTVRKKAISANCYSLAWNGSIYVAAGCPTFGGSGAAICTSTDGIFWTQGASSALSYIYSVAWTGSRFVAVGVPKTNGCAVLTSPDGETWSEVNAGISKTLNSVVWTGNQAVAVGADGTVLTSADGSAWTIRSSGPRCNLRGIVSTNGLFVAVGDSGTILTSPDGLVWEKKPSGTFNPLRSITWSGNLLVAVGDTVVTSPDALTWTASAEGPPRGQVSVTWAGNQFVSVGSGAVMSFSPDGNSWTNKTDSTLRYSHQFTGITWADTCIVAVSNSTPGYYSQINGSILQSKDGQTWKELFYDYARYTFVTWCNGAIFAGADSGRLYYSSGGKALALHSLGSSNRLNSLAWTGREFVVAGKGVFKSTTAEKWSYVPVPYNLNSVAVKGNTIAAVGDDGVIVTAPVDPGFVGSNDSPRPGAWRLNVVQTGTQLTVSLPGIKSSRMTVRLCDISGKTLFVKNAAAQSKLSLSTAGLPSGRYFVSMEYGGRKITAPCVILKR
jgi:hypothetical protein